MADTDPATYTEAMERIVELEDELESLDALLLLRERAASDSGTRHALEVVVRELDAEDLLARRPARAPRVRSRRLRDLERARVPRRRSGAP